MTKINLLLSFAVLAQIIHAPIAHGSDIGEVGSSFSSILKIHAGVMDLDLRRYNGPCSSLSCEHIPALYADLESLSQADLKQEMVQLLEKLFSECKYLVDKVLDYAIMDYKTQGILEVYQTKFFPNLLEIISPFLKQINPAEGWWERLLTWQESNRMKGTSDSWQINLHSSIREVRAITDSHQLRTYRSVCARWEEVQTPDEGLAESLRRTDELIRAIYSEFITKKEVVDEAYEMIDKILSIIEQNHHVCQYFPNVIRDMYQNILVPMKNALEKQDIDFWSKLMDRLGTEALLTQDIQKLLITRLVLNPLLY